MAIFQFHFTALAVLSFISTLTALESNETANALNPKAFFIHANKSGSDAGFALPLFSRPISMPATSSKLLDSLVALNVLNSTTPDTTSKAATKVVFHYNVTLMVELMVGTPPQKQLMVVDTGSELSWLQCNGMPKTSFSPSRSASYSPIPCNSLVCTKETVDFPLPTTCDKKRLCQFTYSYADGTSIDGNLGRDTISTLSSLRGTPLKVPGLVFGCVSSSALPGTPGLMGLNRGALSLISQLKGKLLHKFSYCITDYILYPNSPGILFFGDSPLSNSLRYTQLFTISIPLPYFNRAAYSVRLQGIKVGNRLLPIPKSVFLPDHTGAGQTMIDSGTHFTFLLGQAYTPLKEVFLQQTRGHLNPMGGDFVFEGALDLCYSQPATDPFPQVSPVTLLFDSAQIILESHQLLYPIPKGTAGVPVQNGKTVYCFTFGNSDLLPVEANIIGNHHQQNLWIEYDLQNSRIGFAPARCNA
eukprot:Gb_03155 [translate_table: standard]